MKRLVTSLAALWFTTGAAVADSPVVVELFTSQGCSSCPPADRIFADLAARDDVIALALHVDYWDYLGWKDSFANPVFTARQRAYSRARGEKTVYTPQMVIGGTDSVIGSRPMKVVETVDRHGHTPLPVEVTLERSGGRVVIHAQARAKIAPGAVVHLVTYTPEETVEIRGGENAGRQLAYHNIVRDWRELGTWDGRSDFAGSVRVPAGTPVVVLIQDGDEGAILGASRLR